MTIRFAILAGVSTDAQAIPEKLSIPDQITHCRAKIAALKGIETTDPFIMDGYSRTGYDSLDVAMQEIPPLGAAIRAATADQYDILIMDNFDRLGDLGLIVKTRFKKLRKQLYSARQSGAVVDPANYDPYASDDVDTEMYVQGIIQTYRINKLRRGWRIGVPDRARNGLHPLSVPFGYRAAGKDQPAEPIAKEIELIRQIKDWFLQGISYQGIADLANRTAVKPRRSAQWSLHAVQRLITNEFYAGTTTFGRYQTLNKKRIAVPRSQWVRGTGRHQPVYDEATYLDILNELDRRSAQRSRASTYALSGLLTCSICGTRLHRHGRLKYPVYLDCGTGYHIQIEYKLALQIVSQKVTSDLQKLQDAPLDDLQAAESITAQLSFLEADRLRVQEGFAAHIYTAAEASQQIVAIETDIEKLTRQHAHLAQQHQHRQALFALAHQDLTKLTHWIQHEDPATVNHFLTALCQTITITPMYDLKIVWR